MNSPNNKIRKLQAEFKDNCEEFDFICASLKVDESIKTRFNQLKINFDEEIRLNTELSYDAAMRILEASRYILIDIKINSLEYLSLVFRAIVDKRDLTIDKSLHDNLIKAGFRAIEMKDVQRLRNCYEQIIENMVEDKDVLADKSELAGLMKI